MTGYRLHTERFRHTGKSGIRTFKLSLKTEKSELFDTFFENIKNDHEGQLGATNITTWMENEVADSPSYSLLDFWLDSIRAGVVFAPNPTVLNKLLSVVSGEGNVDEIVKVKMQEVNPAFFEVLNFDAFKNEFALKKPLRSSSTANSVNRRLWKCLDCDEDTASEAVRKDVENLISTFFTPEGKTISGEEQNAYWQENFGLDKKLYKLNTDLSLTFFPLSDITFTPEADAHECLSKYRKWIKNNQDNFLIDSGEAEDFLRSCWGLDDNYNAFSNYLNEVVGLLRGDEGKEKLRQELLGVSGLWQGEEEEFDKRLDFLAEKARQLPEAKCVNSWADYRSVLGGRLSSWLSNTIRQERFIRETTGKQKDELKEILEKSKNGFYQKAFSSADDARAEEIHKESEDAQAILKQLSESDGFDPGVLAVYRDNLRRLRSLLNVAYQLLDEKSAHKAYPALHERVRLVPKFIGGAKQARFEKYAKSLEILKKGISFITDLQDDVSRASAVVENQEEFESYFLRTLNALKRLYTNANSERFRNIIADLLGDLEIDPKSLSDRQTFYISPYSTRDNRKLISVDIADPQQILEKWVEEARPYWQDILETENWGEIIDAVKMARLRWGWVFKLYPDLELEIGTDLDDLFAKAEAYRDLYGDTVSRTQAANFMQRVILSEIEGRVKEASREEFIVRYVVQPVGSESKYPLFITSKEDDLSAKTREQWYIRDINSSFSRSETGKTGWVLKNGKDFSKGFKKKYITNDIDLFKIITSKYQLQFLDKALPRGAKKFQKGGDMSLELSEHSFIAEENITASWDFGSDTVSFQTTDQRLFVAIPMNIEPDEKLSAHKERTRYLGIDVGEYGLAYTLVETEPNIKVLKTGFLYEKTLRNIRKQMTNIKNSQRLGTFGVPSTKLARLREQAVTKLRNKVHDLMVRFDAIPVYEWQIKYFETKSGRVTKIYNSVKRADVSSSASEDADSAEAELVWGKSPYRIGQEVSARATSNMCSKCFKSIYQFTGEDFDEKSQGGEYTVFSINGETVKGFTPGDKQVTSKKDFVNAVHDYARASVEILVKRNDIDFNPEALSDFLERRGRSALYECPFCSHVSDADIQASLFIALRGICKDRDENKKSVGVEELMKFASDQDISPLHIQLNG